MEIDWFARLERTSIGDILARLQDAGLDSLPGGGAEVFSDRVRKETFRTKIGHERWFEVHREAHRLGIMTNATLLYGHIETHAERVDHMLQLRDAQDEDAGAPAGFASSFRSPSSRGIRASPNGRPRCSKTSAPSPARA